MCEKCNWSHRTPITLCSPLTEPGEVRNGNSRPPSISESWDLGTMLKVKDMSSGRQTSNGMLATVLGNCLGTSCR